MKIPTDGLPSVETRPVGTNYQNLDFRDGTEALQRGIGAAGGAFDAVAEQNAKARAKADALVEAEAAYKFDAAAGARLTEFQQLPGTKAAENSAALFKALEKDREEVAKGIGSASAKQRFLTRSFESLTQYRRVGEKHVAGQLTVAREQTLQAREGQAIGMAEAGVDGEAFVKLAGDVEVDIRANAPSAGAAEARIAEFRSKAGFAAVKGMLANGRIEEAKGYLEKAQAFLGGRFDDAKTAVDRAAAIGEQQQKQNDMRFMVSELVEKTKQRERAAQVKATGKGAIPDDDAYLTEEQIRSAIPTEGYDDFSRRVVEDATNEHISRERKRLAEDTDKHRDDWFRADGQRQPQNPGVVAWLWKHDPKFMRGAEHERQARLKAEKLEREGTARERAAEREKQARIDEEYRNRWNALPREEQLRTTPEAFAKVFVAEKAEVGYPGLMVTPLGVSAAAKDREASRRMVEKGLESEEEHFLAGFTAEARKSLMAIRGKKKFSEEELEQAKGNARITFRNWALEAPDGKLDEKAQDELRARLIKKTLLDPGKQYGPITVGKREGIQASLPVEPKAKPVPAGARPPPPANPPGPGDEWIWVKKRKGGVPGYLPRSKFNPETYEQVGE